MYYTISSREFPEVITKTISGNKSIDTGFPMIAISLYSMPADSVETKPEFLRFAQKKWS